MYTLREHFFGTTIIRDADGANIPEDLQNGDYLEFLKWEAEGGKIKLEKKPEKDYKAKRAELYAPIQDQLDMLYDDMTTGSTTWIDHVAAVRAAVPKP